MIAVGQLQMFLNRKLSKRSSNNSSSSSGRGERVENRDMNHSRQQQEGIDRSYLFSNPNNEDRREYWNQYLQHLYNLL